MTTISRKTFLFVDSEKFETGSKTKKKKIDDQLIGIIIGALAAVLLLLFVVVIIIVMRNRKRKYGSQQRMKPTFEPGHVTLNLNDLRPPMANGKVQVHACRGDPFLLFFCMVKPRPRHCHVCLFIFGRNLRLD